MRSFQGERGRNIHKMKAGKGSHGRAPAKTIIQSIADIYGAAIKCVLSCATRYFVAVTLTSPRLH